MGRGKRQTAAREIALSDGDGRHRLVLAREPHLPSLGLRVLVHDLGDGYPSFAAGEAPVLRLSPDEQMVLVYGQEGRTLIGNLGREISKGALLAQILREGHRLSAHVLSQNDGWRPGPLELELLVEAY